MMMMMMMVIVVDVRDCTTWVVNPVYRLSVTSKRIIEGTSQKGWLTDEIINAAQELLAQQYPSVGGLESVLLQETMAFSIQRCDFVQILNIEKSRWITVSNIGCDEGEINIFDSMAYSPSSLTAKVVASMLFSKSPSLKFNVMNVTQLLNNCDCGVLAIAFAYDLCSGFDSCDVIYNHVQIRTHHVQCLEVGILSRFPISKCTGTSCRVSTMLYSHFVQSVNCLVILNSNALLA